MNGRAKIVSLLDTFDPADSRDRWSKEQAMRFASIHTSVLERANRQGHFTGSAFVVDEPRERFLLVWHKKLDMWVQPGGHADGDPDLLAVARREAEEETGLPVRPVDGRVFDIDIHTIAARPGVPAHLHYDVRFLFVGDPALPLAPNADECHDVAWWSPAQIRRGEIKIDEAVERMVARATICLARETSPSSEGDAGSGNGRHRHRRAR